MRNFSKKSVVFTSAFLLSLSAFSQDANDENFILNGSKSVTLTIREHFIDLNSKEFSIDHILGTKTIQLMSVTPSDKMITRNKNALLTMAATGSERDYTSGIIPFSNSSGAVDLGMSNVPVLDKGAYGTCVTFSTIAAIDAKYHLGDYIDQQCSLALNMSLGKNWWNGAYAPANILEPLKKYGIIYKGNCFGSQYPNPSQVVPSNVYVTKSYQGYQNSIKYNFESRPNLDHVKAALNNGNRVLIATLLANNGDNISVAGFDMNINGRGTNSGLWACQQPKNSINYCAQWHSAHEVLVIGYDDKQKLLKIRNSWTTYFGDSGDFYMTYEFFSAMVMNHTEIYHEW